MSSDSRPSIDWKKGAKHFDENTFYGQREIMGNANNVKVPRQTRIVDDDGQTKVTDVRFQTPPAQNPFGVGSFKGEDKNFSVSIRVTPGSAFERFLENLDVLSKQAIVKNSLAWFNKQFSMEVVDATWTPTIKRSDKINDKTGKPYDPTVNLKIPMKSGNMQTTFWDASQPDLPPRGIAYTDIPRGVAIVCIVRNTGIMRYNNAFSNQLHATQIAIMKSENPRQYEEYGIEIPVIPSPMVVETASAKA